MFEQTKKSVSTARPMAGPSRTHLLLGWGQYASFAIGILALTYVISVLIDARLYQEYQTSRFEQGLKNNGESSSNNGHLDLPPLPGMLEKRAPVGTGAFDIGHRDGTPFGRIEISRIGLGAMILEGTDDTTLRRAIGHISGTALAGQLGNLALAAHRDTFFRPLRNIRRDDVITLATYHGSYSYRVDSTLVVEPEDTYVLDDSGEAILTLVTCYPFEFVGSASRRFIVRAHRVTPEQTVDR